METPAGTADAPCYLRLCPSVKGVGGVEIQSPPARASAQSPHTVSLPGDGRCPRGERTAKHNRLLRIEEELGDAARYPGAGALRRSRG